MSGNLSACLFRAHMLVYMVHGRWKMVYASIFYYPDDHGGYNLGRFAERENIHSSAAYVRCYQYCAASMKRASPMQRPVQKRRPHPPRTSTSHSTHGATVFALEAIGLYLCSVVRIQA